MLSLAPDISGKMLKTVLVLKAMINPWPDCSTTAATDSANKINSIFIESMSAITSKLSGCSTNTSLLEKLLICNKFSLQHVTMQDIIRAIADLPSGNSTGNDNISAKMLKYSAPYICHVLADIFNSSIDAGIFPNAWKKAIAVSVHKKGNYFDISNYFPITLFPLISKVFEKLINTQICDHLNDSMLVNTAQHGFRKLRSNESALLRLSKT